MYGITKDGVHCYCQVKRYQKLSQSDIRDIYSAIIDNNKAYIDPNSKFILICACDLSKQVLDVAYDEAAKYGFESVEIISRTKLESFLYNGHRTLLRTFSDRHPTHENPMLPKSGNKRVPKNML